MDKVKAFSTSPKEVVVQYTPVEVHESNSNPNPLNKQIIGILRQAGRTLMKILQLEVTESKSSKEFQSDSEIQKLQRIMLDIEEQVLELGINKCMNIVFVFLSNKSFLNDF